MQCIDRYADKWRTWLKTLRLPLTTELYRVASFFLLCCQLGCAPITIHSIAVFVYVLSFNDYYFCCFYFVLFSCTSSRLPIRLESRETAYIHAINAAALAWSITRACSRGDLTECSCDNSIRRKQRKWQWGGCSEVGHIQYTQHISVFSTRGHICFPPLFVPCCFAFNESATKHYQLAQNKKSNSTKLLNYILRLLGCQLWRNVFQEVYWCTGKQWNCCRTYEFA